MRQIVKQRLWKLLVVLAVGAIASAAMAQSGRYRTKPGGHSQAAHRGANHAQQQAGARQFVDAALARKPTVPIENPLELAAFFRNLQQLESKPASAVHVVQYGDSHTAADFFTGAVRKQLQSQFGDGGIGWVDAGRPFAGYRAGDTGHSMSAEWRAVGTHFQHLPDGNLGPAGVAVETSEANALLRLEATVGHVELDYLQQPQGGRIEIVNPEDGSRPPLVVPTEGALAARAVEVQVPPGRRTIQVRTIDATPVRLFGWTVDNPSGITWEAAGLNGAEATLISRWDEVEQEALLRRRNPALVVLAYGTNEAANLDWNVASYMQAFGRVVDRIHRIAPQASILVLGPGDRQVRTRGHGWRSFADRTSVIVEAQRAVCRTHGCGWWDWRTRMGASGSMNRWVAAGLAQADHTHYTQAGYALLAGAFVEDLNQAFENWKTKPTRGARTSRMR